MKFHLFSDLHLELAMRYEQCIPHQSDADVIVLAGDIHKGIEGLIHAARIIRELDKDVIYVPGNHEFYRYEMKALREEMKAFANVHPKLHLLDNDEVIFNDTRFLGSTLWTDYELDGSHDKDKVMNIVEGSLRDHRVIKYGDEPFNTEHALELHQIAKAFLKEKLETPFDGKTIVVTHHAPSLSCAHPFYGINEIAGGFISDLDELVKLADVWCYGHTHANVDTIVGECRLVSNQYGYKREILPAPFQPQLMIEV